MAGCGLSRSRASRPRLSDGDGPRAEDGILAPRRPQRLHLLGRRGHPSARKTVARRRADRRARERPSLERRIALTGGWPDTANGWAACSASGPARSTRPTGTSSPPTPLRATCRYEADAHARSRVEVAPGRFRSSGPGIRPDRRRGDHG
jgi:hypothetical protein